MFGKRAKEIDALTSRIAELERQLRDSSTFGMAKRLNEIVKGLEGLPGRLAELETLVSARSKGFTLFSNEIAGIRSWVSDTANNIHQRLDAHGKDINRLKSRRKS